MNHHASQDEVIFESPTVEQAGPNEHKLASYKNTLIDKPAGFRGEDVSDAKLNPEMAYGVFNGKLFYNSSIECYSLADGIERRVESPLQRYARLRGELDELKTDLDGMVESEVTSGKVGTVWATLQQEAAKLSDSAAALEAHRGFTLRNANESGQERMLTNLVSSLGDLQVSESTGTTSAAQQGQGLGPAELVTLEQRVHRLETVLGSAGNLSDVLSSPSAFSTGAGTGSASILLLGENRGCPYPLLDAVRRLEERMALMGAAELETLRTKCEAVRGEVESSLKSKSALSAEAKVQEAARQLSGLIGAAEKVDAVAADLPALVLRLKTLEHVHGAASGVVARLSQMEGDVRTITGEVAANREVLAELKRSVAENVATMQQNVASVSDRISQLA